MSRVVISCCLCWLVCDQVDKVTVDHLTQHFIKFVQNDNLGQISTWLLAHADDKGADSPECEQLAELHSKAVDFPKTGQPAALSADDRKRLVRHLSASYIVLPAGSMLPGAQQFLM